MNFVVIFIEERGGENRNTRVKHIRVKIFMYNIRHRIRSGEEIFDERFTGK